MSVTINNATSSTNILGWCYMNSWRRSLIPLLILSMQGVSVQTVHSQCFSTVPSALDAEAGDRLGFAVAIDGDTALVGAYHSDDFGLRSGSAYIFRRVNGAWEQEQKLLASDGAALDRFGWSVDIDGPVAVVGAWYHGDQGFHSGAVYVYRFDGVEWCEEAKLLASDGATANEFGYSVAIDGDVIVSSALQEDIGPGKVYMFRHNGSTWLEESELFASDGAALDWFGIDVAIDGNLLIVGATRNDDLGDDSGSAYVFRFDGESWIEEAMLLASDGKAGDRFGNRVAVYGEVLAVASIFDDEWGPESGSAYVFVKPAAEWIEEAKVVAPDGAPGDLFAWDLALQDDLLIVGAPRDDGTGVDSGSIYLFPKSNGQWTFGVNVQPIDAAGDQFGWALAANEMQILVGAPFASNEAGKTYVYEVSGVDCNTNTICDATDIRDGTSDINANGVPDECEGCLAADTDGDSIVGISDFLLVLAQWGPCPPQCLGDVDGDGEVGILDFLLVLANWGPCT